MPIIKLLNLVLFGTLLAPFCLATVPLDLVQFKDCLTNGAYDANCVLQPGEYLISDTILISRSNIIVEGAWPYAVLRRAPGFTGDLMRTQTGTNWVTVRNLIFHGNRWNGATSVSYELNLSGCSYCQVTDYMIFIGSPYSALGVDPAVPSAVLNANFQGNAYFGVLSWSASPVDCDPSGWSPSRCLILAGSSLYNNGVSAVAIVPRNALIAYNDFSWNHSECPYGAPGGQIDLDVGSNNVDLEENSFQDGPSCPNGYWAVGVELHGTNIRMKNNLITRNAGEGIYMEGAQGVTIESTDPSAWHISENNRRGSGIPGCGGFPGIRVHSSYQSPSGPTEDITIQNVWSIGGHSFGIELSACGGSGPPLNNVTIQNNCVSGNISPGIYSAVPCYGCTFNNNQWYGTCGGDGRALTASEPPQAAAGVVEASIPFFEQLLAFVPTTSGIQRQDYFEHLGLSQSQAELILKIAGQFLVKENTLRKDANAVVARKGAEMPSALAQIHSQRRGLLMQAGVQVLEQLDASGARRITEYARKIAAVRPKRVRN